jgi:hypothetical protein
MPRNDKKGWPSSSRCDDSDHIIVSNFSLVARVTSPHQVKKLLQVGGVMMTIQMMK